MERCGDCSPVPQPATNFLSSWWFTRTAASILILRMSCGAWPPPASWLWDRMRFGLLAAIRALTSTALKPMTKPRDADKARRRENTPKTSSPRAEFLLKHPQSTGKLGAVGFCFGGGMVNRLAVRLPQLAAGVPFYGAAPAVEDVPKIKAVRAAAVRRARIPTSTARGPHTKKR